MSDTWTPAEVELADSIANSVESDTERTLPEYPLAEDAPPRSVAEISIELDDVKQRIASTGRSTDWYCKCGAHYRDHGQSSNHHPISEDTWQVITLNEELEVAVQREIAAAQRAAEAAASVKRAQEQKQRRIATGRSKITFMGKR